MTNVRFALVAYGGVVTALAAVGAAGATIPRDPVVALRARLGRREDGDPLQERGRQPRRSGAVGRRLTRSAKAS